MNTPAPNWVGSKSSQGAEDRYFIELKRVCQLFTILSHVFEVWTHLTDLRGRRRDTQRATVENEGCQGVKLALGFCFCLRPNSQAEKTKLHKTLRALSHVERQAARQLNINDNIGFAQIPYHRRSLFAAAEVPIFPLIEDIWKGCTLPVVPRKAVAEVSKIGNL